MDLKVETTRVLNWSDWESLEALLRRKMQSRLESDPDYKPEDRAAIKADIRDMTIPFAEVYRFARYDHHGMFAALFFALSERVPLATLRDELSPFDVMVFLDEVDIFGVPTRKASPGNASSASGTEPTGGQSEPS